MSPLCLRVYVYVRVEAGVSRPVSVCLRRSSWRSLHGVSGLCASGRWAWVYVSLLRFFSLPRFVRLRFLHRYAVDPYPLYHRLLEELIDPAAAAAEARNSADSLTGRPCLKVPSDSHFEKKRKTREKSEMAEWPYKTNSKTSRSFFPGPIDVHPLN